MRMRKHLVICGYGKMGAATAKGSLGDHTVGDITIIEADAGRAQVARTRGLRVITGDASEVATQRVAQVGSAPDVIVCIDAPVAEEVIGVARRLSPSAWIQAAVAKRDDAAKLLRAGADYVLVVSALEGELLANSITG